MEEWDMQALTRLRLTDEEGAALGEHLQRILGYVAVLDELDTADVEPTSHVLPMPTPFREDVTGEPLPRDKALENAPEHDGEAFVVPKVV